MLFLLLRPPEIQPQTLNCGRHDLRHWTVGSTISDPEPWEAQPQMLDRGRLRLDTPSVIPSSAEGSAPPSNKQPGHPGRVSRALFWDFLCESSLGRHKLCLFPPHKIPATNQTTTAPHFTLETTSLLGFLTEHW